jgi:hypothetical protein
MNEQNFQQEYEKGRNSAMTFAGAVYTGAVLAGTMIFLFFVLTAFPQSAYVIRALMVMAGLLVGASALAFPVALHNWAVSKTHRLIATLFYYGEIALIILNTVVSFSTLLYTFAGNEIPAWVAWYEPFTIMSLGYVVLAWGTIFITDPHALAKAKKKEVHDNFIISVAQDMERWTKSIEGKEAVQQAALQEIVKSFQVKPDGPQHWNKPEAKTAPADEPSYHPVAMNQNHRKATADNSAGQYEPWTCLNCQHPNGDWGARFCAYCATERNPMPAGFSDNGNHKVNPR